MSFSAEVKNELCRNELQLKCCARAEAYGILLFCRTFTKDEIRIVTESYSLAQRLPLLFRKAFDVSCDENSNKNGKYYFTITNAQKIIAIISMLGFGAERFGVHHINLGLLEESHCQAAFVRGAFLSGGSVIDPKKRYHLELVTSHVTMASEMDTLLREMELEPKMTTRKGNQVIYFKQSAMIEDFLTRMGAPTSAIDLMTAKIEKDMTNHVNRQVNCNTANLDKSVEASTKQIAAIKRIAESGVLETLTADLQETAVARMYYPELTLAELAETFDPPITKSCLNHRMRKIMKLAGEN